MDPMTMIGIGQGVLGLLNLFKGKKDEQLNSPELNRLLGRQLTRMQSQNPMFESVAKMAFSRMPVGSRAGIAPPSWAAAQTAADNARAADGESDLPEVLQRILQTMDTRMGVTDPLFQAVSQLVGQRMPRAFQPSAPRDQFDRGPIAPGPDGNPLPPPPPGPEFPLPPGDDSQSFTTFSNAPAKNPWAVNYGRY